MAKLDHEECQILVHRQKGTKSTKAENIGVECIKEKVIQLAFLQALPDITNGSRRTVVYT